jgi:transcriptional regulator with XRE-family HTH domain
MVEPPVTETDTLVEAQMKRMAERLRAERKKLCISQMDLSFKAGLAQNQVNCIETGKITPTISTILKICNALNISPAVLFDGDEERKQARNTVLDLVSRFM